MDGRPGTNRIIIAHPDQPDARIPAYLTWARGSEATIAFDLLPDPPPDWIASNRLDRLFVIEPEPATLFDVLSLGGNFGAHGSTYRFQAAWTLFGDSFDGPVPKFDVMDIETDGCATWFGTHGFKNIKGLENITDGLTIEYFSPMTQYWPVADGLEIGYGINTQFNRQRHPNEALHIEESPRFTVKSPHLMEPRELLRVGTKAMSFVEFATDETLWIDKVHVGLNGGEPGSGLEMGAAWKQERSKSTGIHWLFFFKVVEANFGEHLAKWFELYDAMPLALDLYRVNKRTSSLQVEFRLFSIISALESLHRTLFGEGTVSKCPTCKLRKTMSLEQRLRDIVKRHGESIQELLTSKDCKFVADTRNYLAHQTPQLAAKSIPSDDWFAWYRRLMMVFEICVLAELPFQHPEAFKNIVAGRWNSIKSGSLGEWNL